MHETSFCTKLRNFLCSGSQQTQYQTEFTSPVINQNETIPTARPKSNYENSLKYKDNTQQRYLQLKQNQMQVLRLISQQQTNSKKIARCNINISRIQRTNKELEMQNRMYFKNYIKAKNKHKQLSGKNSSFQTYFQTNQFKSKQSQILNTRHKTQNILQQVQNNKNQQYNNNLSCSDNDQYSQFGDIVHNLPEMIKSKNIDSYEQQNSDDQFKIDSLENIQLAAQSIKSQDQKTITTTRSHKTKIYKKTPSIKSPAKNKLSQIYRKNPSPTIESKQQPLSSEKQIKSPTKNKDKPSSPIKISNFNIKKQINSLQKKYFSSFTDNLEFNQSGSVSMQDSLSQQSLMFNKMKQLKKESIIIKDTQTILKQQLIYQSQEYQSDCDILDDSILNNQMKKQKPIKTKEQCLQKIKSLLNNQNIQNTQKNQNNTQLQTDKNTINKIITAEINNTLKNIQNNQEEGFSYKQITKIYKNKIKTLKSQKYINPEQSSLLKQ